MKDVLPVILAGGIGERLYPLSIPEFPKQFSVTYDGLSLFQHTLKRVVDLYGDAVVLVRIPEQATIAKVQSRLIGIPVEIVVENNYGKSNTYESVKFLVENFKGYEHIVLFPSDHYVSDLSVLLNYVNSTVDLHSVVIQGSYFHPQYGNFFQVEDKWKLIEKPYEGYSVHDVDTVYWNTGIYQLYRPVIEELIQNSSEEYQSFDYAVQNWLDKGSIIYEPIILTGDWRDLGTWKELVNFLAERNDPRVSHHEITQFFGYSENGNPVIPDVAKVIYSDTVFSIPTLGLVQANGITAIVNADTNEVISKPDNPQPKVPVYRKWGYFRVLEEGQGFKVKELVVLPGESLSLQRHYHRTEHWIVHSGVAQVRVGQNTFLLKEGESTFIPVLAKHQLSNPGKVPLKVIEVQRGDYLEEDDIERFPPD